MELAIWHNPRCSKSRQTLALIEAAGIEPTVRLYLEQPPSPAELAETLAILGVEPWDLARMGEALAKEVGLDQLPREHGAREDWIRLMSANSKLIERPIVLTDDGRGVIGRPPENVNELLG